ncbi:FUZ [Lepeophtheirus salmonis]|uniref:FUZ n=2 Tax=Lepeophtheirus salmonis TaxID=72036 RepID=A0A7R8D2B9_LEPSM|nr:FUZ [Lepeophtheirus salmonis]CAF2999906.1 FUZ [Lepeophtheirus salmonis]
MSAYISCITVSGGVPILNRRFGKNLKPLTFPQLASLNGVALFGKTIDVTLLTSRSKDCKFLWRDYHGSLRLILVTNNDSLSDIHCHRLLDYVFLSMILVVGFEDLIMQKNIDRVKRDLRASYGLIDTLIANLQPNEKISTNFGDLVGSVDCVISTDANNVQNYLDSFTESVDSTYGCVFIDGKIVTSTKNWWGLHPDELTLLSLIVQINSESTISDIPIFLPIKSPTVPFRLVSAELIHGVRVAVLCGPSPSLEEINFQLCKQWHSSFSLLRSVHAIIPRGFPPFQINTCILGFLLVNLEKRRVLSSMQPHFQKTTSSTVSHDELPSSQGAVMQPSRKLDLLRSFYKNVVGPIFPDILILNNHNVDENGDPHSSRVSHSKVLHPVRETYLCSEYHKCYATQIGQYQMFCLFVAGIPNHNMR